MISQGLLARVLYRTRRRNSSSNVRQTYEVRASRSGQWWALDIADLGGERSQVRRLYEAEATARDVIASALDVDADSFDIVVVATQPA
jgi:hypothetical protein